MLSEILLYLPFLSEIQRALECSKKKNIVCDGLESEHEIVDVDSSYEVVVVNLNRFAEEKAMILNTQLAETDTNNWEEKKSNYIFSTIKMAYYELVFYNNICL